MLDYVKVISLQECSRAGLNGIAKTITTLADAEGLKAHGDSVRIRSNPAQAKVRLERATKSSKKVEAANA